MTLPEVLLWQQLRARQLHGLKFRRQHPIGPWILDFICLSVRLAVEVDGDWAHSVAGNPERDTRRDAWLRDRGIRVLRIPAQAVLANMDGVLRHIAIEALGYAPEQNPSEQNSSLHLREVDRLLSAGETEGVGTQTPNSADARRGSGSGR